jgi:yopX protein|uniref:YopX protein n=1 Tax=Siphoviridae sp. ctxyw6 TaxID=2825742 RepID=A0A8S5TZB7_9CAUD|nr:MAG TPA: YopX protein [Siphoviridae sp. ctxyw6]
MKQPKVYIKRLDRVLEVESIRFDTKVVEIYDEAASRYRYCDFDEVAFIYGTGFKDKNGKEIESGDILKTEFEDVFTIKFNNVYGFCAVDEDDKYWFADENLMYELREALSKSEVIGNIYEKKELLEE